MDYNTETVTTIATELAEAFRGAVAERLRGGAGALTIAEVETEMRQLLRQVGACALSQFLSCGRGTPVAELPCACGGTLHYQRRRAATLTTVFGKVRYERAYYAGCACGQGMAPLDQE